MSFKILKDVADKINPDISKNIQGHNFEKL
jgi:hypothetical protein